MKAPSTIALAALLLAACGGGGGGGAPALPPVANAPGSEVPASATQDPAAAFTFVSSVAASPADSAEPLVIGDAMLATSDTDEPQPL